MELVLGRAAADKPCDDSTATIKAAVDLNRPAHSIAESYCT